MIKYTVYINIEAFDESKVGTSEDDCWHEESDITLGEFDNLKDAEELLGGIQEFCNEQRTK